MLQVENLRTYFPGPRGLVRAVDGVSFTVAPGEVLGIAGETGSGKSVTLRSIMGLLPQPPARIKAAKLVLEGVDLLACSKSQLRGMWGKKMAMIFQDPATSLNPLLTIATQLTDVICYHMRVNRNSALFQAQMLLEQVGMPDPAAVLKCYPFQLSGGMQQRVMIAIGLSCQPSLLLVDEPTTALDVTIQAQILNLLRRIKGQASGLILVSHDLAVIAQLCDTVAVLYAGKLVERGPVEAVLQSPLHPYTQGLLAAIPQSGNGGKLMPAIPGSPPSAVTPPPGCRFSPRCAAALPGCSEREPGWYEGYPGHFAACHLLPGMGKGVVSSG
jgi:oligopeptide/dipeptide ABC transporter ATP-binding protein